MQKAKAEAEEAARSKSESTDHSSDSKENNTKTPTGEADKALTPKQEETNEKIASSGEQTKKSTALSSSRSKHKKTRSESAREATFASLQRALDAAAAAREQHNGDDGDSQSNTNDFEESVSPTTTTTTSAFSSIKGNSKRNSHSGGNGQSAFGATLEWEAPRDPSVAWSHGSQEQYGYAPSSYSFCDIGLNGFANGFWEFDSSQRQEYTQGEEWMGQVPASSESLPSHHRASHDTGSSYSTMQYPLQTEASLPRRTSSDELANHLEGIGIHTTIPSNGMPLLTHRADKASWKETGKELDLAARRKRPRPAAIGTSKSSSMLSAAASMSPNTTRMPSYGSAHGVRQSKSAQSLNSRYAGVRKASAAQRSPLNFSTFSEAGGKADMSSILHPITTNALAPPTPLTPEDMHHLLPTSPSDSYCLSAHPSTQVFPTTQPMQISVASPPATPLTVDMMSSYPYQNTAPPMSAPAHYTSFPEYTPCEAAPLTAPARTWGETPSISSPDQSYHPSGCQVPQPADISPIAYNPAIDASGQTMKHEGTPDMSPSIGTLGSDGKFMIQEFPDQQEAHRFVAQQLPPQPPKHYTFTNNQTPNDF